MAMKDQFEGNWTMLKGKVKEKWGRLTDDDIEMINGRKDQLIGRLQKTYGYARDKAMEEVKSFEKECSKTMKH